MPAAPPPPFTGESASHDLEWDPPHGMSSAARWTCRACGSAVLSYAGNVYGGAVDRPCPSNPTNPTTEAPPCPT